ncbi:MAG: sugar phosphate isomerase/epimerase [Longimicrobiales bacterium]|nr:sugar phosphate isomerase/epimerase [Longimicrobiales bacterium]
MDRRAFLGAMPLMAAALGDSRSRLSRRATASPGTEALEAWGVQLYTLRDALAEDLEGTLAAVSDIGYREVELFQLHGLSPGQLRRRLDSAGLRAASGHYPITALRGDLQRTLEGAQELGLRLLVVPSIPQAERSPDGLVRVADDLTRAGERARGSGLRVGYHNHDWELRVAADSSRPIDILLDRSDPELVDWQMDLFWTVHGGGDPSGLLTRRAGRVTSVHVKDRTADGRMVDVGEGVIDFATILRDAEAQGLAHAFVEHDRPEDPVESVRRSYRHLTSLGFGLPGIRPSGESTPVQSITPSGEGARPVHGPLGRRRR